LKDWFNTNIPLNTLGLLKHSVVLSYFKTHILPGISPYFKPLKRHLSCFKRVLFPSQFAGGQAAHSVATAESVIDILKTALLDQRLINDAKKRLSEANDQSELILGKHSRPSELTVNDFASGKVPKKTSAASSQQKRRGRGRSLGRHANQ
jgi:hypothetical protein